MNPYFKVVKFSIAIWKAYNTINKDPDVDLKESGDKLTKTIETLGPTYIKLGQMLSLRYDLFPKEFCRVLEKLLDSEEVIPYGIIKKVLISELGENYKLFKEIEKNPVATASIGQVHIGYLKTGEKVAIKIQKPGVKENFIRDIRAFYTLATIVSVFPPINKFRLVSVFNQYENWTMKELDFTKEASNTIKFKTLFKEDKHIYTPKVYLNLNTKKILVTEFIEGVSLKEVLDHYEKNDKDIETIHGIKLNKDKLLSLFKDVIFDQAFAKGFIHGDPHPSNIIIRDAETISFIDFGIVAEINKEELEAFKDIGYDITKYNIDNFITDFLRIDQIPGSLTKEEIKLRLEPYFNKLSAASSYEYSPAHFLLDAIFILGRSNVQIPGYFIILAKILITYDGIFIAIKPESKLFEYIEKKFETLIIEKKVEDTFDINNLKKLAGPLSDIYDFASDLPKISSETFGILKKIEDTQLRNLSNNKASKGINFNYVEMKLIVLVFLNVILLVSFMASSITTNQPKIGDYHLSLILGLAWFVVFAIILLYILLSNSYE